MDSLHAAAYAGLRFDQTTLAWSALPNAPVLGERSSARSRLLASLPWAIDRQRPNRRRATPAGALNG